MKNLIIQPAGKKAAEHYRKTIKGSIKIDPLRFELGEDVFARLKRIYPEGDARVWGVTPSKDLANLNMWAKVSPGDVVLFTGNNRVFASAVVTMTVRSKAVAKMLWDENDDQETWECIYFIKNVKNQNIRYEDLNDVLGYSKSYPFRRFLYIDEYMSKRAFSKFNSINYSEESGITKDDFLKSVPNVDAAELDKERTASVRIEQGYLRKCLFGDNDIATCCICGESFPVEFLVASHIKKRCVCSDEEKRDAMNIVAPMCCFGCDDLFERGYVGVIEGVVKKLRPLPESPPVEQKVASIVGRRCPAWRDGTKKYFLWHAIHHAPV